ncbi:M12 family metallo-peptidase [Chryseobacterium taklimakanense]|uniref:reprolysin-like metallopeptidase n=1 Tax=Chryseobacterium taklimakanense TaxID=536441 RepID=UPI001EF475B1|nr:zinc-dependent metalloprotease family protein [Chryseobacterium taklimakanense]MCG7281025.1 M12 family metallo-peptidase [Chryseobacterium taklimakanense]
MNQQLISFLSVFVFGVSFAQWNPVATSTAKMRQEINVKKFYSLDVSQLKAKLKNASETGRNAKPVEIQVPTLEGSVERFAVYSAPVVASSLEERYDLGSYVGVGIDDPGKYIRFSISGKDFQSMVIKDGQYEFIETVDQSKTVFGVYPKTSKTGSGKPFVCSTNESVLSKQQLNNLFSGNKTAKLGSTNFAATSDRKFRTLRIAISTTAEYTNYFGGVPQAIAAINATLTTVNGILERDVATRLILQDLPQIIFTDPETDPYSAASTGVTGIWSTELMNTLHNSVGDDNFDIGHLFGASGGGGNARCIGCICTNDLSVDSSGYPTSYKGSAYTSPADGKPFGDVFNVDYVTHEIGHQLGATHTFSHQLESYGSNIEPGSGSTLMGYAGITSADVQKNTDPYFHGFSISQIQNNLISKTCDVETAIANSPPVISAMPDYTVPRSTAFVLTANATDAENDPLTYTWEQVDDAASPIIITTGSNVTGALFRSLPPVSNPTRYFPKFSLVMAGILTSQSDWESVSNVARTSNYRVTVRDNHPVKEQQQTSFANQKIAVGSDGPFKINIVSGENIYSGAATKLTWDVANTNAAPYNVANVKISYTVDNGATWTDLAANTPNDGSETVVIPVSLVGQSNLQFRVKALGNVFYAVSPKANVVLESSCIASVPQNIKISNINYTGATVSWEAIPAINSYFFKYKKADEPAFTVIEVKTNSVTLTNLEPGKTYAFRVKSSCSASESAYTANFSFTTLFETNCASSSTSGTNEFIRRVEVDRFVNDSGASTYSDFSDLNQNFIYLNQNQKTYSIRVTPKWMGDPAPVSVAAWIDYNGDGVFSSTEQILAEANTTASEVVGTFTVPASALLDPGGVRMRVSLKAEPSIPLPCEKFAFGEVEDYRVIFSNTPLFYKDQVIAYPNPFIDYIYTTEIDNGTPYKVYDMSGRLIRSGEIMLNKIDLSALLPATYLLTVTGQKAIKIIKK